LPFSKRQIKITKQTVRRYLSKDLFSVEKSISTEVAVLLIEVDVLQEVTEEVRETKCNSSLVGEQMFDVVADVTGKIKIRLLPITVTHQTDSNGCFLNCLLTPHKFNTC